MGTERERPTHELSVRLTPAEWRRLTSRASGQWYLPASYARLLLLWALDFDEVTDGSVVAQVEAADPVAEGRRVLAEVAADFARSMTVDELAGLMARVPIEREPEPDLTSAAGGMEAGDMPW